MYIENAKINSIIYKSGSKVWKAVCNMLTIQSRSFLASLLLISLIFVLSCKRSFMDKIEQKQLNAALASVELITGRTFYVSPNGDDLNDGLSMVTPWKTLEKVSSNTFLPGDKILFQAGGVWSGMLAPKGSGTGTDPIEINKYGSGERPILNGNGTYFSDNVKLRSATVMLTNQSGWRIVNLEITNTPPAELLSPRSGIRVFGAVTNPQKNVTIDSCYVHDVDGRHPEFEIAGGITIIGKFDSVLVQNCEVKNTNKCGIWASTGDTLPPGTYTNYFHSNITFRNNKLSNVFSNTMVMSNITNGGLMEYNFVENSAYGNGACIWTKHSKGTIVQYNEVCNQDYSAGLSSGDAEAFDADNGVDGDVFQYNYSHGVSGGFMLVMPGAKNVTVRFNVSQNDGGGIDRFGNKQQVIHYTKNTSGNNHFYNNTFYIGDSINTSLFEGNNIDTTSIIKFNNNIIHVAVNFEAAGITSFYNKKFSLKSEFKNNCFYPITEFQSAPNYFTNQQNLVTGFPQWLVKGGVAGYGMASAISTYSLKSTSPCIGKGFTILNNGGLDFAGKNISSVNAHTIGAIW